jgi:probable ribonuclease FAU-1
VSLFPVGSAVRLEHVKPWKATTISRGVVSSFDDGQLTIQRTFKPGGRYDTLGDRIEAGDHGVVEVIDGGWVLRRAYFRANGRLIGELYNVQTPVELSPGVVRYTDLEVDVARFPDGRVQVVDEQDLATVVQAGAIAPELAEKALRIAHQLAEVLRSGGDWRVAAKPS